MKLPEEIYLDIDGEVHNASDAEEEDGDIKYIRADIIEYILAKKRQKVTDVEKFIALFDDAGIGYKEERYANELTVLKCCEGEKMIDGSNDSFTVFEFKNGKFNGMGAFG